MKDRLFLLAGVATFAAFAISSDHVNKTFSPTQEPTLDSVVPVVSSCADNPLNRTLVVPLAGDVILPPETSISGKLVTQRARKI